MKVIYSVPRPDPVGSLARRPVSEVMSSPVAAIPEGTFLGDALQAMVRLRRRHLVVLDRDGSCAGVLTDRAIAGAWAHDPGSLAVRPVRSVLPASPAVVGTGAKVLDVARLMRDTSVDAVVVADPQNRPVGIVTGTDLVALLAR